MKNKFVCRLLLYQVCFSTDIPGPVLLHKVTTNFTSITFSWTVPSANSGVIKDYEIQLLYDGTSTTVNNGKETYILPDLSPDTRVVFSVSAVSICGAVGVLSTTTEYTSSIRKLRYNIQYKYCPIFSNCYFL